MAIHASCWGSGADVCNYPSSVSDTASHASQDGAFLASAGIAGNQANTSSWDLVFTDTSDRDAGYYQYVYGNTHTWWDRTDQTLPNFANFRAWLAGVNAGTGRRIVLWQTPVGNQYFATENNTDGHYQDNRAEYFLGDGPSYAHLTDFANAGVVGMLFGRGAGGPTTYDDSKGDGVTNPAPVTSYQCNACNTHVSQYSDDDGGYLRLFGGAYLNAGGVAVPGAGTPSTNSPTPVGATTTPSARPTSTSTPVPPTATVTNTPIPPTATATSTKTPTSVPPTATRPAATRTPGPLTLTWNRVGVGATSITAGATETFTATITSNQSSANELVDFEVYNSAGVKVWQTYQSPVSFAATTAKRFTASWATPSSLARGTYTLRMGVFPSTWSPCQAWNGNAATVSVS